VSRHVVHVADYGNPAPGSFIPALFALASCLHEQGDRCSLVSRDVSGAVWHRDARRNFDTFATASSPAELYRSLLRARPDVVHVHFNGWVVPAAFAGNVRGVPVIWHLHSAMDRATSCFRSALRAAKYRWLGRAVHRFVTVSEQLRSAIVAAGAPRERTTLIRNAVDAAHFHPPIDAQRLKARSSFGIGEADRALLYFGRDVAIKGGDILWRALTGVRDVVLIAVGAPAAALAEFRSRVRTIEVPFVADTAPLYWAADALVMPSRREGAPYTLLEALCSGLPAIASDIEPLAEIGRGEPLVTLVRNEPEALADAIGTVAPRSAAQNGDAAERFGLERWVREVSRLYAA
jgi:glycosyltransferase involved in cell wall biosynthesis